VLLSSEIKERHAHDSSQIKHRVKPIHKIQENQENRGKAGKALQNGPSNEDKKQDTTSWPIL